MPPAVWVQEAKAQREAWQLRRLTVAGRGCEAKQIERAHRAEERALRQQVAAAAVMSPAQRAVGESGGRAAAAPAQLKSAADL